MARERSAGPPLDWAATNKTPRPELFSLVCKPNFSSSNSVSGRRTDRMAGIIGNMTAQARLRWAQHSGRAGPGTCVVQTGQEGDPQQQVRLQPAPLPRPRLQAGPHSQSNVNTETLIPGQTGAAQQVRAGADPEQHGGEERGGRGGVQAGSRGEAAGGLKVITDKTTYNFFRLEWRNYKNRFVGYYCLKTFSYLSL